MTVKELIEALGNFPENTRVCVYGDDNGSLDSIKGMRRIQYASEDYIILYNIHEDDTIDAKR